WWFFELSQHPTCPQVTQSRSWTHESPEARHSSQPSGVFGLVVFSWSRCEQVGCAIDPLLETACATATTAPVCPSGSDYEFLKLTRLPPDAVIESTFISGLPERRPHPLPRPPPPASPGTPPTSRGRVPSSLGPLPRLRRVLPRLRGNAVHLRDFGEGSKDPGAGDLEEPEARARDR